MLITAEKIENLNPKIFIVILISCFAFVCNGQRSGKLIIHTDNCNELIAGIDNYISIIAMQDTALSVDQISAYLITPSSYLQEVAPVKLEVEAKYGKFFVHPDSVGVVEFRVQLRDEVAIETIGVKPLEAVCRLSKYKANSESTIGKSEFKAQMGIVANVECCGFDASCQMLTFEVLRIPTNAISSRVINHGARFNEATLRLIHQAKSGDLYIFRNLYYRCPGTEKQRSEDMIIEIE